MMLRIEILKETVFIRISKNEKWNNDIKEICKILIDIHLYDKLSDDFFMIEIPNKILGLSVFYMLLDDFIVPEINKKTEFDFTLYDEHGNPIKRPFPDRPIKIHKMQIPSTAEELKEAINNNG